MLYGMAWIAFRISVAETRRQVGHKLLDVLILPTVFALEIIDGVLPLVQNVEYGSIISVNLVIVFAHRIPQKFSRNGLALYCL
jgi:hypothetical protein